MSVIAQWLCVAHLASACTTANATETPHAPAVPPPSRTAHLPTAVDPPPCGAPPPPCDPHAKYRRVDGSCNNLQVPTWGMAGTPYVRLLPSRYDDGAWTVRRASDGSELPNARQARLELLPDKKVSDPRHSLLLMQWGQLVAHDAAAGAPLRTPDGGRFACCSDDEQPLPADQVPDACLPITIAANDSFYSAHPRRCMSVVRTDNTRSRGCSSPAQQINFVNHLLDASFVYGNNENDANFLRTFQGGTLKVQKSNNKEFLPNVENPRQQCDLREAENVCYKAGDFRVNLVPQIAALQVIFLRIHNNLAWKLSNINPHWKDETIYQEARKILIGYYQHITYNEFLPLIIGHDYMKKNNLLPAKDFSDSYDIDLNPATISSFTSSAFRGLHSLIQGKIEMKNVERKNERTLILSEWFNRPSILQTSEKNFDMLLIGLTSQSSQKYDNHHTSEVTNLLFRGLRDFGVDLISFDILRNRDYGLPAYNEYRNLCGLAELKSLDDFINILPEGDKKKLKEIYRDPNDIDLTIGGLLELPLTDSLVGPTFQCLIGEQFIRWKMGDRFFYEFGGFKHSFTKAQLQEIKKITFARLLCDHSDDISIIQPKTFQTISKNNPLLSCNSSVLLMPDLNEWKEVN